MVNRLLFILLVASVAFGQTTTPNLGLIVPANGQTSWDTLPTGGINANWAALDAKVVSNAPIADQTITGSFQLINRGVLHVGVDLTNLSAFAQSSLGAFPQYIGRSFVFQPATSTNAAFSSWDEGTFGVGIYSAAGGTATVFHVGVEGDAYTTNNNDEGTGIYGYAQVNSNAALHAWASYGIVSTAATAFSAGGTVSDVAADFYADIAPVTLSGGGKYASFYSADPGADAAHYGVFLEGAGTHNDLGGGVTKVGNLLDSGLTASLPVVANGSKQLVSAAANIPSVFLCGTTTACANTLQNTPIIVFGTVALSSGTPSTATLTALPFAGTTAYVCTGTNQTTATNNLIKFANASASSTVITGPNTITDVIGYTCVGH